jgi:diguanylate cyclase (GGDEF)-like protein
MHNISNKELLEKIAELESKVHSLENELIHDKLTSAKTRGYFEEKSKEYLDFAGKVRDGKRRDWAGFRDISFLFFDIDHFKKINDTYGHDVGDKVLKEFASVVKNSLRVGDIFARWGGEEFVVILLGSNEMDSKVKADEIRKKVEDMTFDNPSELKITVSIGVAEFDGDIAFENLIKNADNALYKAKDTGRNKVVVFSEI